MKKIYVVVCLFIATAFCASKVQAQSALSGYLVFSNCDSQTFRFTATTYLSTLQLTTYFGDGSSQTDTFLTGAPPRVYANHVYGAEGVYTVKEVLLNSGVAIDSATFSDTVTMCSFLDVTSYVDNNADCAFDAGDTYLANPYTVEVDSAGIPVDTITSTSFYYDASGSAPMGTVYTFRILTPPSGFMVTCPASGIWSDTISATTSTRQTNVGFICDTTDFDLAVYGWFSPGVTGACTHVYVNNYGCTPEAATVTINYSPKYAYSSILPAGIPAVTAGNSVTLTLGTVSPGTTAHFIAYFTPTGTPVAGDTVNTTWTVDPTAGDANPANNLLTRIDTVHASFDPNEKAVSPQGYIVAGTQLQYNIGFENTGNDTAFNIHVQDSLSDDLDISTLKLVSASAPVYEEISTYGAGHNVVKFDFPHIDLQDISHPGACNGMVVFTIKTKPGLPNGTFIDNTAAIYFDYNAPVMTNKVRNIIGTTTGVATLTNYSAATIYPNPATDQLTIKTPGNDYTSVSVTNVLGQLVSQQQLSGTTTTINVSTLPSGIYSVTLKGDKGLAIQKFEKL